MSPLHPRFLLCLSVASLVVTSFSDVLNAASPAPELNWPAWRGPTASGVAPQANPPVSWSESHHIKWKIKLPGRGTASPIIWENQVFLQAAVATGKKIEPAANAQPPGARADVFAQAAADPATPPGARGPGRGGRGGGGMRSEKPTEIQQFVLLSVDRATGRILWQKVSREELPHEGHHRDHGFASHSPVTDGQQVYAYFGSRGLHCYDLKGNLTWQKDLGRMQTKNGFGEGSSPVIEGHILVINWDHEGEDFIAAFDKHSGKELWRQIRDEDTTWSTPLIAKYGGKAQVVTVASAKTRSYDLATGHPVWEGPGLTANVIPSPVGADGVAYLTSGFRGSAFYAVRLGRAGDITGTDSIAWRYDKNTPYVPSPLLYEGKLYFFKGNEGILTCLDAKSGRVLIDAHRIEALQGVYASPIGAAGRVYLVGRNGVSVVIDQAQTGEPKVLAVNNLNDRFDASPAAVGRELFLRGQESLYCLAEP